MNNTTKQDYAHASIMDVADKLNSHQLWLNKDTQEQGEQAVFEGLAMAGLSFLMNEYGAIPDDFPRQAPLSLEKVVFRSCDLSRASFDYVDVSGAVFDGCDMRYASFVNADTTNIETTNCNTTGAFFGHLAWAGL